MTTSSKFQPRRWQVVGLAIAALLFGLALAGIGGAIASVRSTAQASTTARVGIRSFAFHPKTLTVGVGSKVVFANSDGVTHTATGKGFNTRNIGSGKSVAVRFSHKGSFAYHCEIHPSMHGKIIVN